MAADLSSISIAPQASRIGACDLCTRDAADLSALVTVTHLSGARVQFSACSFCERALRRVAASAGEAVRFVDGSASTVAAASAAETASSPTVAGTTTITAEPAVELVELVGELIQEYAEPLQGSDGQLYLPRVYGAQRLDGTWIGWLQFAAIGGEAILRTNRETTQPNRAALAYWASRLQPSYLEGAFNRARRPHLVRIV